MPFRQSSLGHLYRGYVGRSSSCHPALVPIAHLDQLGLDCRKPPLRVMVATFGLAADAPEPDVRPSLGYRCHGHQKPRQVDVVLQRQKLPRDRQRSLTTLMQLPAHNDRTTSAAGKRPVRSRGPAVRLRKPQDRTKVPGAALHRPEVSTVIAGDRHRLVAA